MDFADPSVAGYTETPSSIIGLQNNLESLEKEKNSLREKIGDLEQFIKDQQQHLTDKDGEIASLQRNIEQLNHERDQTLSMNMENHIGGVMGGISNLSEMEALINFKEKEIQQFRVNSEIKIQEYK